MPHSETFLFAMMLIKLKAETKNIDLAVFFPFTYHKLYEFNLFFQLRNVNKLFSCAK